jgi:hypothetical protein
MHRENRHDLHGIARKNREVRVVFEELGSSIMRICANDRICAHQVGYVLDAALAHLLGLAKGTAHLDDCGVMLFGPRFPCRDALLHLRASNLFR